MDWQPTVVRDTGLGCDGRLHGIDVDFGYLKSDGMLSTISVKFLPYCAGCWDWVQLSVLDVLNEAECTVSKIARSVSALPC